MNCFGTCQLAISACIFCMYVIIIQQFLLRDSYIVYNLLLDMYRRLIMPSLYDT